ncbi:CBS domain-containing protein [Deinococcus budaensis]|uniref:Acetoin utilization protein AcuB n=1 Tax=Deinococcus budaensis TaxID=1665626 RepID=A0A7W8LPP3_9DEIO|nr:CBS domain-containing protein [Deinococcus budaensis]MBB5233988.1 acetoin utilization protein AcuB [Deinococcus budaensis]
MNTPVKQVMAHPPVTAHPDTTVPEAVQLLKARGIRRLPLVEDGRLVGMVTDRDLKEAMPSQATTLSIWEITALLARMPLRQIMTTSVLTVSEDAPLQDAAYTMLNHKIGGLPVVNGAHEVVGIVTVTDVLREYVGSPVPG